MKRSWLIPRFSLSNLLMLMVVVGLSLAWYDQRRKLGEQAEVIEKQRLEMTRLTVNNILRSEMTDAEKAKAVGVFVAIGDPVSKIEAWSKHHAIVETQWDDEPKRYGVSLLDCGLKACCYCRNDRIYWIGYAKWKDSVDYKTLLEDPNYLTAPQDETRQ